MILEPTTPPEVLAAIRAPFEGRGARAMDAPVMQPLSLMLDLVGEAVRARLFAVQTGGVEEACLRPDFTIPIARAHIASAATTGRYLYEGKAFRVAPQGSDRPEEFLQVGLEVYEAGDITAQDAEIIAMAFEAARAGGRDDLWMQLGDIGLYAALIEAMDLAPALKARMARAFLRPATLKSLLDRAGAPQADGGEGQRLPALLAGLEEGEATSVLEELWALAGIQPVGGRSAAEIVRRLTSRAEAGSGPRLTDAEAGLINDFLAVSDTPQRALDRIAALAMRAGIDISVVLDQWRGRLGALQPLEASMVLSAGFGREFGYYDGMLFEVRSRDLGDGQPVAAGGRYDCLLERLGAPRGPGAVGCMVRPWRAYAGGQA